MSLQLIRFAILLQLFLVTSCNKNSNSDNSSEKSFASRMKGEAYLGTAKSTLYLHGHEALPSVSGKGSFSLGKVVGDSVMLALVVELRTGDGFTMGIPGKQTQKEWSAKLRAGALKITENGEISGEIDTPSQTISWDGHLFHDRIMLDIRLKYLKAEGNITEGSILLTHLDLNRSGNDAGVSVKGCKRIVWQNRPIFNIYAGGVDLMQVPVCLD